VCSALPSSAGLRRLSSLGRSYIGVAHAVSRDIYTDITEGFFLLQLPLKSQLLASGGSSSSLTQSRLDFVPPISLLYIETSIAIYRHIASLQGSADMPSLTLQSNAFTHKTAATGDPLRPNCTHSCSHLDCKGSRINQSLTFLLSDNPQSYAKLSKIQGLDPGYNLSKPIPTKRSSLSLHGDTALFDRLWPVSGESVDISERDDVQGMASKAV
jgi:hypothetical protein